jgi:DNA repair exonuclease SbcCD ATPase subunit
MPFQFTQCCAVLQAQQQQAEIEAKRLRVKYETLEKSYDNLKRTRRKKGKAQAQAMVEAAEAQVSNLERHLTEIQAELDETRKSAAEFNAERSKAATDLQNAKSHLERKFAGLQVLFQCLIIRFCIKGAIVQCQQSTIEDMYVNSGHDADRILAQKYRNEVEHHYFSMRQKSMYTAVALRCMKCEGGQF